MSKSEDLLGKADAFLKRYHPTGTAAQGDVPVLTEVITEPQAAPVLDVARSAPAPGDLLELEQKLKQRILEAIGPLVAKTVEEPLRTRLDAHLQRALAALSVQIKTDIEALIREAVARAVEVEIARARGPSKGS